MSELVDLDALLALHKEAQETEPWDFHEDASGHVTIRCGERFVADCGTRTIVGKLAVAARNALHAMIAELASVRLDANYAAADAHDARNDAAHKDVQLDALKRRVLEWGLGLRLQRNPADVPENLATGLRAKLQRRLDEIFEEVLGCPE